MCLVFVNVFQLFIGFVRSESPRKKAQFLVDFFNFLSRFLEICPILYIEVGYPLKGDAFYTYFGIFSFIYFHPCNKLYVINLLEYIFGPCV